VRKRKLYLSILALWIVFIGNTQNTFYSYSTDTGVPTNNIQYVQQDSFGFLWLASYNGLFRWDGITFKKYYHDENDQTTLDNNIVYTVFEDSKKRLWIGTIEGLSLYDRARDRFIKCQLRNETKTPVNAIKEDSKQKLWLGTSAGLCQYDAEKMSAHWYLEYSVVNLIFTMDIDLEDKIWLGVYNNGVKKYNQETNTFTHYKNSISEAGSIPSNRIKSILVDRKNKIWLGSEDKGLIVMGTDGHIVQHHVDFPSSTPTAKRIIDCIYEDKNSTIWVGVGRQPLYYVNQQKNELIPIEKSSLSNNRNPISSIVSICEDKFGNIWFGSNGYGLFYTNEKKNIFKNYFGGTSLVGGYETAVFTAFCQDKKNRIWLGTNGNGLFEFNPSSGKVEHVTQPELSSLAINDLKLDNEGNIWIATYGAGVKRFDPETKKVTSFLNRPGDNNSLVANDIKAILADGDSIWIGTHGEGLCLYDKKQNVFIHHKNNKTIPIALNNPAWINHLFKDSKSRIWISTYSGIFLFEKNKLTLFEHSSAVTSISSNSINMATEDQSGNIWIVSELGLDKFNEKEKTFTRLNTERILPETMKSILVDEKNEIWIGSNDGLTRFDPQTKRVYRYDQSDGLHETSFFQKACFKSTDNRLYFGGPKGFDSFYPDNLRPLDIPSYLYFTDLYIYNELQVPGSKNSPLSRALSFQDTIVLEKTQSYFSIGLTGINLYAPSKIKYSYLLKGLQHQWIEITGDRRISFANLPHGNYDLQVRCTNASGEWQNEIKSLHIVVLPAWWQTWWFRSILVVFIVGAAVALFYWRVSSIRQRNALLKKEVNKRTLELRQMNASLIEQNDEIKQQKESLEQFNTEILRQSDKILEQQSLIINQKKALEETVSELEQTNKNKDHFFSVLAHDLKNPVSALADILSFMKNNVSRMDPRILQDYLNSMHHSSQAVYDLLINLLNWSRSQSGNISYVPVDFELSDLTLKNLQLLQPQFVNKNIQVKNNVNPAWVFADSQMIDVVIRNVLNNCIKFTEYNGEVTVDIREEANKVILTISDNGIGMSEDQLGKLFGLKRIISTQGTAGEQGTGLGLLIVKEFVDINKGELRVESRLKEGSTFRLTLPKSNTPSRQRTEDSYKHALSNRKLELDFWDTISVDKLVKLKGRKVLIVDDNKDVRNYLKLLLATTFEIFEAENGQEALQLVQSVLPAVIVSDLLMPGMNGLQLCREIKGNSNTSHIPVIILTSQWEDDIKLSGLEAGADAYLTKPLKKEVLLQVILNFINAQERLHEKLLERIVTDEPLGSNDAILTKLDDEFLNKLVGFIEQNISDASLDAKMISKELGVSRTVLYAKIKNLTGQTVHGLVKSIKLRRSVKLLLEGRLSISQIAFEVGFNSHSYFDKCFHQQYGMGPKEYLQKKKAGQNTSRK
jgi:ligand-binding sensor domain-containing protein/signal transduction histidine kinase/CheY-like chemotaxis protein/AraC-like DNA-binding protein